MSDITTQKKNTPKVLHNRGSSKVKEDIARSIVCGDWPEDGLLPTEIELADSMGVARTSAREALSHLKGKGLLESRQKTGTRVLPRKQWNMLDEDVLRWAWSGNNRFEMAMHLMQIRRIIEPAACALVAELATDKAIATIERAYRAMDAAGMDAQAYAAPDLEFHKAILRATENPFLVTFGATIEAALKMSFELSMKQPEAPRKGLAMHRALLEKIWEGKPEEAKLKMEYLLEVTESNIKRAIVRAQQTS